MIKQFNKPNWNWNDFNKRLERNFTHSRTIHLYFHSMNHVCAQIRNANAILTDSVPPSTRFPPRNQVIWAGGLEPELRQTISDDSPTTNWSSLFTIETAMGATAKTISRVNFPDFFLRFAVLIYITKTHSIWDGKNGVKEVLLHAFLYFLCSILLFGVLILIFCHQCSMSWGYQNIGDESTTYCEHKKFY